MRILLFLLLGGFVAMPASASAGDLERLLRCNADALGGAEAVAAVETLRIGLEIAEPGFEVTGRYVASREGRMRIDIFAGEERVFAEGLDGEGAWQWTPGAGRSASRPAGAAALRNGVESPGRFWTLAQLRERGLAIEWLADESPSWSEQSPDRSTSLPAVVDAGRQPGEAAALAGERALRLMRADGSTLDYFLDSESCLPTREVSRRAFHPDVDPTEVPVETRFSEARVIDGVLRHHRSESRRLDTGEWLGTTVVTGIEQDVEVGAGFYTGADLEP